MSDWRADPDWRLVHFLVGAYEKRRPPARPPKGAELSTDPCFASVYRNNVAVATWFRSPSDNTRRIR